MSSHTNSFPPVFKIIGAALVCALPDVFYFSMRCTSGERDLPNNIYVSVLELPRRHHEEVSLYVVFQKVIMVKADVTSPCPNAAELRNSLSWVGGLSEGRMNIFQESDKQVWFVLPQNFPAVMVQVWLERGRWYSSLLLQYWDFCVQPIATPEDALSDSQFEALLLTL